MAQIRLNFGISDELALWVQTQPAIQALDISQRRTIVTHTMSPAQLSTFKTNFINRLAEDI
jgi:hypothetical protein